MGSERKYVLALRRQPYVDPTCAAQSRFESKVETALQKAEDGQEGIQAAFTSTVCKSALVAIEWGLRSSVGVGEYNYGVQGRGCFCL